MTWQSTSRATRLPHAARDAVWKQVCDFTPESSERPAKPVCCFALQGVCRFSASTCEFSHRTEQVRLTGCQFGLKCRVGHAAGLLQASSKLVFRNGLNVAVQDTVQGDLSCIECTGPNFDDSDPLWNEVAFALRTDDEDLGDCDLPTATRQRLQAAGQYHLIDEDTADEWICVPARFLLDRLESLHEGLAKSRRFWLLDDLGEAKDLWDRVSAALRPGNSWSDDPPMDGALHNALGLADASLQNAFAALPGDGSICGHKLIDAFAAAQGAVRSLQKTGLDGQLDSDADEALTNIWRCLERCMYLLRAMLSDIKQDFEVEKTGRSRSPRRLNEATTLLELVREASVHGDDILIHHVVAYL
mmetsp:Transcript_9259/g.17594  ORF Transcript_9259/g.17594 Transcript_9259/m.17594 type:complete len:359 (-) Transcript_9259:24-1100(-)